MERLRDYRIPYHKSKQIGILTKQQVGGFLLVKMSTIQLVSSDLSHQETILQIVDALDHLDKVTEKVFSGIQAKINENAAKLSNLDHRVQVADDKVKLLAGMNQKATCIYSSAKYPDQADHEDYVSALSGLDLNYVPNQDVIIKNFPEVNVKGLDARDVGEKRRYFHLPVKKKPTTSQLLEEHPDLRIPPRSTNTALSYLIFNTAENPYAKQPVDMFVNPLEGASQKSKKSEEPTENPGRLGDAPSSFGQDTDVDSTVNLFFAPALGDLPDLDLPDILDLPNLPTDLSYSTDLGPGIAPSVQAYLPDLQDLSLPEDTEALLSAPPPPPPPASAIPPPPIEPMTNIPLPPPLPPMGLVPDLPPPMAHFQPSNSDSGPTISNGEWVSCQLRPAEAQLRLLS